MSRAADRPAGEDRLAEVHAQLTAAVAELASSAGWRTMLTMAARLPTYSTRNLLLVMVQRPNASMIGGYGWWRSVGRQVRRGEHGIKILAPVTYRRNQEQQRPEPDAERHPDRDLEVEDRGGPERRALTTFKIIHVFDVSQTDGEPLPEIRPTMLDGAAPAGLWDRLTAQVRAAGYTLDRGDCGPANGYTDPARRHVRVRADVPDSQAVRTLAHELGHVLLHDPATTTTTPGGGWDRGRAEVEAESVAYLIATGAGMRADAYSVPYVAGWAGGDSRVLAEVAERVVGTARAVLAGAGIPPPALPTPVPRRTGDRPGATRSSSWPAPQPARVAAGRPGGRRR